MSFKEYVPVKQRPAVKVSIYIPQGRGAATISLSLTAALSEKMAERFTAYVGEGDDFGKIKFVPDKDGNVKLSTRGGRSSTTNLRLYGVLDKDAEGCVALNADFELNEADGSLTVTLPGRISKFLLARDEEQVKRIA